MAGHSTWNAVYLDGLLSVGAYHNRTRQWGPMFTDHDYSNPVSGIEERISHRSAGAVDCDLVLGVLHTDNFRIGVTVPPLGLIGTVSTANAHAEPAERSEAIYVGIGIAADLQF